MRTATGALPQLSAERRFHLSMATAMLLLIVAGFGPSYYFTPFVERPPMLPMTPLVHLHGLVFSAWLLLFLWQVGLVSAGRTALHRKAGPWALALALAMIVTAILTALEGVWRASGPPPFPPLTWLAVPLLSIPAFAGLILAALYFRRQPQVHKRLMLFAMIVMLTPATGRLFPGPIGMILLPALFALAMVAWDLLYHRRLHITTAITAPLVICSLLLPFLLWRSEQWLAFAAWAAEWVR